MNFFDDITKLEPKKETKKEPNEELKEGTKKEPNEQNNSYTELQAQITELKELLTKLTNKGDNNNDD